jgi:hypothetical protein
MGYDRKYLVWALVYVAIGMGVGVYMGASQNHMQHVSHAHILLVGTVISFIYGIIHKLWLDQPGKGISRLQFGLHQTASIVMFAGLLLFYGNVFPEPVVGPMLGIASVGVLAAALLMIYMVAKPGKR